MTTNLPEHVFEYGRSVEGFWVRCTCGESRYGLLTSGMVAGFIAEHDPNLREMQGTLEKPE